MAGPGEFLIQPRTQKQGAVMSSPSIEELKREALEVFGVTLTDEQADIYKGRLPTMLQNVRRLESWAGRLGDTAPAQIQQIPDAGARE